MVFLKTQNNVYRKILKIINKFDIYIQEYRFTDLLIYYGYLLISFLLENNIEIHIYNF